MTATINFNCLGSRLNSANFAHCISKSFNVINAWLQSFRVWSKPNYIPSSRRCHTRCMIFA
jgi:hypothetical protein